MTPSTRVDIVIPVLNEAHVLEHSVRQLQSFLSDGFPYDWRLVIVDNGSTDGTSAVARRLCREHRVAHIHLPQPGRGGALRYAWNKSDAGVVCYTDVDLSTDLAFLRPLVDAVAVEGYAVVTGSRLLPESRTKRSLKREIVSRLYNMFLKLALGVQFSDAQCGFKAVSREAVEKLVPQIADQSWFFDTELLVLAEKQGLRFKEIPIDWSEDDDSRVKILQTAWDDIKGVMRLRRQVRHRSRQTDGVTLERRRP